MRRRSLLVFLTVCSLGITTIGAAPSVNASAGEGYSVVNDTNTLPILTPSLSERKTAKIRLPNGLEAFIISDPGADKSAAALSVHAGSWSEPSDANGLAHFLEHMLFLGTSKYPNESEYHSFVKENGGLSNAYTTNDHTSYMFSINHDAFKEAVDRFSWFFKDPLFNPSGIDREVQAIDQEFATRLDDDHTRRIHVYKAIANSDHPFQKFTMGNLESLKDASQERLKAWYHENYSANLMHLAVYSALDIDTLIALVEENFSAIINTDKSAQSIEETLFPTDMPTQMLYIAPVKDLRSVTMTWELPERFSRRLDTRPGDLAAFVLGHEGEESLLQSLKQDNLAEGLSAGSYDMGDKQSLFSIEVSLTEQGLKDVDRVIERCFQAIAMLQSNGVPPYIFDEEQRMDTIRYQYQSREDPFGTVTGHARAMLYEALESYPLKTSVITSYNPSLIKAFLEELTPRRCLYAVTAQPELLDITHSSVEPWMKVPYTASNVEDYRLLRWEHAAPTNTMDTPPPNTLVPSSLSIVVEKEAKEQDKRILPVPKLLIDDRSRGQVYLGEDTRFRIPELNWHLTVRTPAIDRGNARTLVLADLAVRTLDEILNPFSYQALLAGLNFGISPVEDGIAIKVDGYSQNAPLLLEAIFEQLKDGRPDRDKFAIYKKSLGRAYANFSKESPLSKASEQLKTVVYEDYVTQADKAKAIKAISYNDLVTFMDGLFDRCYLEGLLYGNMTEDQGHQVWQLFQRSLPGGGYPKAEQKQRKVVVLPKDQGPFLIESASAQSGNAVILAVQNGPYNFTTRAAQQILGHSIDEPFFSELRTKQQTGYIVYSTTQEIERQLFSFFAAQSNSHNGRDLVARFEQFIESYLQEVDKTPDAQRRFDTIKGSIITNLSQAPKNMDEMASTLELLAFRYDADFDWVEKRISALQALSFEEYLAFAEQFLGRSNRQRLAVMIKGKLPAETAFDYHRAKSVKDLKSKSRYFSKEMITDQFDDSANALPTYLFPSCG